MVHGDDDHNDDQEENNNCFHRLGTIGVLGTRVILLRMLFNNILGWVSIYIDFIGKENVPPRSELIHSRSQILHGKEMMAS